MNRRFLRWALCAWAFVLPVSGAWAKESLLQVAPAAAEMPVGESLTYRIEWIGIPVGTILLKVEGIEEVRGRPCYHLSARSFPNRYLRKLYDLEYQVHSYVDVEKRHSLRFVKVRRMKDKFNQVQIEFDQAGRKAEYSSWGDAQFVNFSKRTDKDAYVEPTDTIEPDTQDLLSSFFYFRYLPLQQGTQYPASVYYERANWKIFMETDKAFVREFRGKGEVPVIGIAISSPLNNFIFGKKKFLLNLTTDCRRIPIEFKVGSALGSIRGVIDELPVTTQRP